MLRGKLKYSRLTVDLTDERRAASIAEEGGDFVLPTMPASVDGPRGGQHPEWHLAQAGERLQDVVTDLEGLVFEAPGLGSHCRSEVHDAIGLVMDALQALGRAQLALKRSRAKGGTACSTVTVPMSRA
jgi:hypothetical protein